MEDQLTPAKKVADVSEPIADALPEVTGYDTDLRFYATRFKQGGRTVFAVDLSPDEIRALVPKPDPATPTPGNRAIRLPHAQSFAKYVRDNVDWISPGIILRAPAVFKFEKLYEVARKEFGTISVPRQASLDIRILDGQHRILGFWLAEQGIASDLDKARSTLAAARRQDPDGATMVHAQDRINRLNAQRARLSGEGVSAQIYIEEDAKAYKQMFFDIADNALGITASVKARFDTRKVVNRALETVLEHPLLANRVDAEADRIGRGSPYLLGAKHVAEIIRSVQVGLDGRVSRIQDLEWKEQDVAKKAKVFFDVMVDSFPQLRTLLLGQITPDDLRKSSLLGSVLFIRVLAGVYHDLKDPVQHAFSDDMVEEFFTKLAPHANGPTYDGDIWTEQVDNGVFGPNSMGPHGRRQDLKFLKNTLVDWAIEKPAFLDAPPAPRPVIVDESIDPLAGAGYKENPLELLAEFEDK